MNKTLLWLDDFRNPFNYQSLWCVSGYEINNLIWVNNYNEFVEWINENGLPYAINFDHDLTDEHYHSSMYISLEEYIKEIKHVKEPTGYECASWLVDYCINNKLNLPIWKCHSANPVGRKRIEDLLNSSLK